MSQPGGPKGIEFKPGTDSPAGVLVSPHQVRAILGLSKYLYKKLLEAGELKPIMGANGRRKYVLSDVYTLAANLKRGVLGLPYDKFVMALALSKPYTDVNAELGRLMLPPISAEHYQRLKIVVGEQDFARLVRENGIEYFFKEGLGRTLEIAQRPDVRLVVDCLHMIGKGEKEIQEVVRKKFGKEYDEKTYLLYLNYFFNLAGMSDASMDHYFSVLPKREANVKRSARRRFDYVVYYALGIDYPGDIGELIERSCLGLLYEFNTEIDGRVFDGDKQKGQIDTLERYSKVIVDLFSAAREVRREAAGSGRGAAPEMVMPVELPKGMTREELFGDGAVPNA